MSARHLCTDLSAEQAATLDGVLEMVLRAAADKQTRESISELAEALQGTDAPDDCALAQLTIGGVAPGESLNIDGALDVAPSLRQLRDLVGGRRVVRVALVAHIEFRK